MGSNSLPSSPLTHRNLERLDLNSPLFRSTPLQYSDSFRVPILPRNPSSDLLRTRLDSLEEEHRNLENSINSGPSAPFLSRPFSPLGRDTLPTAPYSRSTSMSSPEQLVPGPSRSPLLSQSLLHRQDMTSPFAPSRPNRVAGLSPTTLHSLSSMAPSPTRAQSPPSAAALSVSHLHPPVAFPGQTSITLSRDNSITWQRPLSVITSRQTSRHPTFYFSADMVVLQVETYLYRLPCYTLCRESAYFRSLLAKQGECTSTDDAPISLPDVTKENFDTLLHFLYHSIYEPQSVTLGEWVTILALSSQLQFDRIREMSIRQISSRLSSVGPVITIVLASRYNVKSWLAPAYLELCKRSHPLDDDEAEELGALVTARVGRAREEAYRAYYQRRYGTPYSLDSDRETDDDILSAIIQRIFGCDISGMATA